MARPFPLNPKHPERICWGCDRYCADDALACGNGSGRVMHPAETQGEDGYLAWGIEPDPQRPKQAALQVPAIDSAPWCHVRMWRAWVQWC